MLSILIPTKNRYETLVPVVRQILDHLPAADIEIVIEDNSDQGGSAELGALLSSDKRIVYHHDPAPVSMVENTVRALEHSSGDYLCFIGDDDLVSPFIMDAVELMKVEGSRCLIYPPARYWWRSVHFAKETAYQRPGAYWLPTNRTATVTKMNPDREFARVLNRGGVAYLNLPRLYHGIVHRSALEDIKGATGSYLPGSSPDMAFSVALALVLDDYINVDYPVSVFGASRNSGGGMTAANKHHGRIEDQRHMPSNILDNWDDHLPRVWSEQIIYPQTIHEVTAAFGHPGRVSYAPLYASLLVYEPHIFHHVWPRLADYCRGGMFRAIAVALQVLRKLAGRARVELRKRTGATSAVELHAFEDISDVMTFMATLPPLAGRAGRPFERWRAPDAD